MKTISQVAELTGISVRTLQYYDEIGLLSPSKVTEAGYRLYGEDALEKLQQILFFKELDFKLKEIKEIIETPEFDKHEAYRRQKKLLSLKRDRIDGLILLLEKLERGEQCMSFKEFDLKEYVEALEQFKEVQSDEVIKHWGSVEKFDEFIRKIREDEANVARLAIKQFGSVEKYTEAMKQNLEHFPELMQRFEEVKENKDTILKKSDALYISLTSDLTKDVASPEIQAIVREIVKLTEETSMGVDLGDGYWDIVAEMSSNESAKKILDAKYGEGAAEYIGRAIRYYVQEGEGRKK